MNGLYDFGYLRSTLKDVLALLEPGAPSRSSCPFCGHDPYEWVDVGVGFVPVAVTCCSEGIGYFQYNDPVLCKIVNLLGAVELSVQRVLDEMERVEESGRYDGADEEGDSVPPIRAEEAGSEVGPALRPEDAGPGGDEGAEPEADGDRQKGRRLPLTVVPEPVTMDNKVEETSLPYRVKYVESERGWGRSYDYVLFESLEDAVAAYRKNREHNRKANVELNGAVPDYYYQAEEVQVLRDMSDGSRVWKKVESF